DASLVIEACSKLLGTGSQEYRKKIKEEYKLIRENFLKNQSQHEIVPLAESRKHRFSWTLENAQLSNPEKTGIFELSPSLKEIVDYIDWSPFFWAWELKGLFPQILNHPKVGEEATKLYESAQEMLKEWLREEALKLKVLFGIFPAES